MQYKNMYTMIYIYTTVVFTLEWSFTVVVSLLSVVLQTHVLIDCYRYSTYSKLISLRFFPSMCCSARISLLLEDIELWYISVRLT